MAKAPKLCQILAIEQGIKKDSAELFAKVSTILTKTTLLQGISRTYRPRDDEGEHLPAESTRVQITMDEVLHELTTDLTKLFDVTATKDWANTKASADIVVDGQVLLADVPATYILFLEKRLIELCVFVKKLPVLDQSEEWHHDEKTNTFATPATLTARTKKIPRNHVKAEATPQHPAQVEVFFEDRTEGYWSTVKYSGALPQKRIAEMLARIEALQSAVKFAREQANGMTVTPQEVGTKILDYVFGQ